MLNLLDDRESMLTNAEDAKLIIFLIQLEDSFLPILEKLKNQADDLESKDGVKTLKKTLVRGFEIVIDESHNSRNNAESV